MRGIDGNSKMSKSLNNVINLKAAPNEVEKIIKKAYSGKNHALFEYAKVFGVRPNERMSEFKPKLIKAINKFLKPIRERRKKFASDPKLLRQILDTGREKMRKIGKETLKEVRDKMGMNYSEIC